MIRTFGLVSALALATALGGCASMPGFGPSSGSDMPPLPASAAAPAEYARDTHTYARPEIAHVRHVALDLTADFRAHTLAGTASLDIQGRPGANEVVLDVKNLDIRNVTDAAGAPLQYETGASDPIKGQPLTVRFPALAAGEKRRIVVAYSTRPDAAALQWLTPSQTAGGQKPYLFSQGQAILTRTWVPTQDSPGIRQTYDARIVAPADLRVVMSAQQLTPEGEDAGPGMKAWRFRMTNPVPPYLIAIGVGDLAFAAIDERTGVFTEPSRLEAARAELAPTAAMVDAAERLYGPYRWGRYDLLVLPPSFPFGGMENPRLTFATPTIIAGDQSLVSLVAHELAHSWSGNLVTNATWNDMWLNEGFTVYFENRIMEALYGEDRALMLRALGWGDLQTEMAGLPAADTRLHLDLEGRDPDEGLTDVAYEKGAAFLFTIERIVGRERFDAWLKSYFERNAFRPMTTDLFLQDIRTHLIAGDAALERQLMMDAWIYQPGMPSNWQPPVSGAFGPVDAAARAFFADKGPASAIPWAGWSTQERQRFLAWRPSGLRDGADWLTDAQLADLESSLNLRNEGNAEVLFAWLQIAVQHRYQAAVPTLENFLTTMGRRKFVLPLFTSLWAEGDWGRPIATRIYARARPGYHPVTTGSVDAVVGRPN
ncbi:MULTISPECIES: M1 family metallopeptidase [unclassified Brevundimonas]|uniref:M1 family metallopeptidase n=1 Tax=unclassified Brevundimonas TaxID=2622653 RepID=UPI0006F324E9|nr:MULTISPECIES: M1 family metallopeptidase [unclassified Brevundimonas]KQY83701.1 aminopeptidase [Brevundimonas sp. Root1423]KRA26576.1 aminopeptidase [Brevundimonas sp. Root608]